MKKQTFIITIFLMLFFGCKSNADISSTGTGNYKEIAKTKVFKMQQFIGFNDFQAGKLIDLECNFLIDSQKIDNCCLCNKEARSKKLLKQRNLQLEKILDRASYIRYLAIENKRIYPAPIIAK